MGAVVLIEQLRRAATISRASADNGGYLCQVSIDQAEEAAEIIEALRAPTLREGDEITGVGPTGRAIVTRPPDGPVDGFGDSPVIPEQVPSRPPPVVCLCGSTRFMEWFHAAGWIFTLRGWIVLSVGVAKHVQTPDGGHAAEALGDGVAERLHELHLRKIDMSDLVFVLDFEGYVGASTTREIQYATKREVPICHMSADTRTRDQLERRINEVIEWYGKDGR